MSNCTERPVIVIDNGSGVMKAGLAGKEKPILVPTVCGRPKLPAVIPNPDPSGEYFGDIALKKRALLRLRYPMEHGVIKDWDEMVNLYNYIYKKLKLEPKDQDTLLTEPPLNSNPNREKMAEVMFENFGVPSLFIVASALLSLHAAGRCCGVVVDCGDGVTSAAPIYSGVLMESSVQRMDVAGRDVTDYLSLLLAKNGYDLTTPARRDMVREVKESMGYVATNLHRERARMRQMEMRHELPDGQMMTVCRERFFAPEILFQPQLIGSDSNGVAQLTYDAISGSREEDIRNTLADNIVLVGGGSFFPNFDKRLKKELSRLDKDNEYQFSVIFPAKRAVSAWRGGSLLACEDAFRNHWISKDEYQERGKGAFRDQVKFITPCGENSASHQFV